MMLAGRKQSWEVDSDAHEQTKVLRVHDSVPLTVVHPHKHVRVSVAQRIKAEQADKVLRVHDSVPLRVMRMHMCMSERVFARRLKVHASRQSPAWAHFYAVQGCAHARPCECVNAAQREKERESSSMVATRNKKKKRL